MPRMFLEFSTFMLGLFTGVSCVFEELSRTFQGCFKGVHCHWKCNVDQFVNILQSRLS